MSAIAGIVHFDGAPVVRSELERMSQALEHFGRDGERISLGNGIGFLARTTLITPEDRLERQPVVLAGHDWFLFAGRLDNRPELIRRLNMGAIEGRTQADSALAAHAWARWGRESLIHMIGVFSVASWNSASKCLTLGRSAPFGKSLYFHRNGSRLYFASAPQGLFALPQVPRELNEVALGDILVGNAVSGQTLFQKVAIVPDAHWVTHTVDGSECSRYWKPDRNRKHGFKREEDAWDAFRILFEDVVKSHLRSIYPVGVQMSGGLDSAAVAGQAALILARDGKSLHGYTRVPAPGATLRPDGRFYNDERPRVEQIGLMHPNLKTNFIHAGEEPILAGQKQNFTTAYHTFGAVPTFLSGYRPLYRQASADGVRVMLDGVMGNHTFTYNGITRLRALMRQGKWLTLFNELQSLHRFGGIGIGDVIKKELLNPSVRATLGRIRQVARRQDHPPPVEFRAINPDFARRSGALDRLLARGDDLTNYLKLDSWGRRAWGFSQQQAYTTDVMQADFGLDVRSVGADRRVVEFCLSLTDDFYMKDGIERRLARLGLAHLIPASVRRDPSRGRQNVDWAYRMSKDANTIDQELLHAANDASVKSYLNVKIMQDMWKNFESVDWARASASNEIDYNSRMLGALEISMFLRWFQQSN